MSAQNYVMLILLGGLLGIVGQGVRVIVGLKKVNDQAAEESKAFQDVFNLRVLLVSMLIGFVTGAVAIISLDAAEQSSERQLEATLHGYIAPVLAAGYAGTDFIEGFVKKYLPAKQ